MSVSIAPYTQLAQVLTKIRRLTGSANTTQIPDYQPNPNPNNQVAIVDYINSFYNYDLPAQFRSLKLKDKYTFETITGIDTYAFDSEHYTTVEMPCYCAKREIKLFQDPWSFYAVNFNWQTLNNFATGNGSTGPYSGLTTAAPLISSFNNLPTNLNYPAGRVQNILITANLNPSSIPATINITDDGNGNLYVLGDPLAQFIGTIDYNSGAIAFDLALAPFPFNVNIPQGNPIQIQYNPVTLSIPLSIMFFQNQFTIRPVPDKGYTIELIAYRQPTQALAATSAQAGTAELNEWWELIACGAAKKIYEDRVDAEGIAMMDKMLKERYSIAETRTYAAIGSQNMSTLFRDQLQYNYGSGSFTFGGGGSV
jgi:hypothetical protein